MPYLGGLGDSKGSVLTEVEGLGNSSQNNWKGIVLRHFLPDDDVTIV